MDRWQFCHKKPLPFDIDLINFVDYTLYDTKRFEMEKIGKKYPQLDIHLTKVYPQNHKYAYLTHIQKTSMVGCLWYRPLR